MIKTILLNCLLTISFFAQAKTVLVKNMDELNKANKEALPGDIIVLRNGNWNNAIISLNAQGSLEKPIIFKAETAGKVVISGNSKLMLGGTYIVVDGFYFTNGFAGDDAVIKFRIDKKQIANNCRVTNTVINSFNNPKRMDDNYWVMFYGKNNRIDHCTFRDKKNMAVLVAVILDDERSRENFHSIDHNYFGTRLPLASNSGEIIRVGVSEHCEFYSNTQITDNFFEHCDGETEVISIKSCGNTVRNNLFKECQGSVVLRHGNYNIVENNIFLGNGKDGTGGVRVINKGQWVVNNLFYKCRGVGFRSPLSIMNGVPNSPAFRYVAVTEAVIANNSFFECTPIAFCEGSDTERSVAPKNVQFLNNIFYNHSDSSIYNAYDDISGISFFENMVSNGIKQNMAAGFRRSSLTAVKVSDISIPSNNSQLKSNSYDSLYQLSKTKLSSPLSSTPGFKDPKLYLKVESNARSGCGAKWFVYQKNKPKQITVSCKTTEELIQQLSKNGNTKLTVNLTGNLYHFNEPVLINTDLVLTTSQKAAIKFSSSNLAFLLQLKAGNSLTITNLDLDLSGTNGFISTDTSGNCDHSNFSISNSHFTGINGIFFNAARSSVADSIIIYNCSFTNSKGKLFNFTGETTNKGLYNVEKLKISNNRFNNCSGQILDMLRGGNDESTMGPWLVFSKNTMTDCTTENKDALIHIFGTQRSDIEKNIFTGCNEGRSLIKYEDLVRAVHIFKENRLVRSGVIDADKFVSIDNSRVQ